MNLPQRSLGRSGLNVSAIGLGCMGFSWGYGAPASRSEAVFVINAAMEMGITFFDTGELYGPFANEELLAMAVNGRRQQVTLATKVGYKFSQGKSVGLDSSPANIKKAVDGCLRRLQCDYIDLLYQHRVDPQVPIEETVGSMSELVAAGKVKQLGLCEANAETIRRAHTTHPIATVQSEYSLWQREIEQSVIPTLKELGIGLVAFSPLGRGLFGGEIDEATKFHDQDLRQLDERFHADHRAKNLSLLRSINDVATRNSCTSAQVALSWLLQQDCDVVPIPGTTSIAHLKDDVGAASVRLSASDMNALDILGAQQSGKRPFKNSQ
jgi:aryl-alcohol dehydrogenase-like predicted oxidoreductase